MKLLIGMCSGGTVQAETMASVVSATSYLLKQDILTLLSVQIGGYKPHNCNVLVEVARQQEATHIMFIDSDMKFLADGIPQLLSHDKDIVSAAYNMRGNPTVGNPDRSVIKIAGKNGKFIEGKVPKKLFSCDGIGLGFTLIKMSVFDKLEKPYFEDNETIEGEHETEDIVFCRKILKAGFKIWCDPTIKIGHIGTIVY